MNWIDFLILTAIAFALISGFRRGAITQMFGWGGFLGGLILGSAIAPHIVNLFHPRTSLAKLTISLAALFGIAFVLEGIIAAVGFRLRRRVTNPGARHADAVIGSLVAAAFSLGTAWFLGYQFSRGPVPEISRSIHRSAILQWTDNIAPRPPGFLAAIGRFLDRAGFPQVFAQLNPSLAPGVAPPPASLAKEPAILRAADATFKVEGAGCGGVVDGSGFPLDRGTVITAAHVVAGTRDQRVIEPNGNRHGAVVVYFDAGKDIAVLRVTGLPGRPLVLEEAIAARGSDGAAIGYPGGGRRTISPARVRTQTSAVGRDIYSERLVSRDVYVLSSRVIQGNSGGPFVDLDGQARGMIFAASSSNANEAYALAGSEILRAYNTARNRTAAVATGRCAL